MTGIPDDHKEALWQLFDAAKRFREQIEIFRGEEVDIDSILRTVIYDVDGANNSLIREMTSVLWEIDVVRRARLIRQGTKLDKALKELGVEAMYSIVDLDDTLNSRVKCVMVRYPAEEITPKDVRSRVETAKKSAIALDPMGIIYASNLKRCLEEQGLYGVALQDMRDKRFDWLLADVISKGRLLTHVRREEGLPRRMPKEKKTDKKEGFSWRKLRNRKKHLLREGLPRRMSKEKNTDKRRINHE